MLNKLNNKLFGKHNIFNFNMKNLFILVFIFHFYKCKSQEETYWKIENIYNDKNIALIGQKAVKNLDAQDLYENHFHFIKNGNDLKFLSPNIIIIRLDSLVNFSQLGLSESDNLKIIDYNFDNKTFNIKYNQNLVLFPDSEYYTMVFNKVNKKEFNESIDNLKLEQTQISNDIKRLKNDLVKNNPIKIESPKKIQLKQEIIFDSDKKKIEVKIPHEMEIKESGALQTKYFDNIRIGTFLPNSKVYDIIYSDENYIYDHVSLWLSTDISSFNIEDYLVNDKSIQVVKRENDNIYGYKVNYNKINKEMLCSFFIIKYYKLNNSHVFIYYETSNVPETSIAAKNKIVNFNYFTIQNIEIKN